MIYPVGIPAYTGVSVFDVECDWLHKMSIGMKSIVEIGCYKGRSTYCLACDSGATVHAVDIWDGVSYDACYDEFLENMKPYPNVIPHKMTSHEASLLFAPMSVDMVFIDGAHDYESVKHDIDIWFPKCRRLICGHDYNSGHPGVQQAVHENRYFGFRTLQADEDPEGKSCLWYYPLSGEVS